MRRLLHTGRLDWHPLDANFDFFSLPFFAFFFPLVERWFLMFTNMLRRWHALLVSVEACSVEERRLQDAALLRLPVLETLRRLLCASLSAVQRRVDD